MKKIRFINSHYNELFTINDGESIKEIINGEEYVKKCTYIDDYHTQIGFRVFHICEYAELMERIGGVYEPLKERA